MAGLVDYTQDPSTGAYTFVRDDGAQRMAFGPEADALARHVDMLKQTRPLLAQNMSTDPGMSSSGDVNAGPLDYVSAPPAAPPARADVGPNMSEAPGMSMAPEAASPQAMSMGAPAAPAQTPFRSPQEREDYIGMQAEQERQRRLLDPFAPVRVGGRPAFNPQAYDASLAPVRTGTTTTVQGALPETPEETEKRLKDEQTRREAMDAALKGNVAAGQARVAMYEEQAAKAKTAADAAQEQAQRAQAAKMQRDAEGLRGLQRLEVDRANIRSMKVDPKRLFRTASGETNPLAVIGAAIAQGLGAFGAAMTGTRNFAADIIDSAIQRDVDAQAEEINRKGADADNALSRFMQFHQLDMNEAKEAVAMAQRDYATAQTQAMAAQIGTVEAKATAANIQADMMTKNALTEAQFKEMYGGRVTTATQARLMAPQAGSAGGYRNPTRKEILEGIEVNQKLKKLTGEAADPEEIKAMSEARQAQTQEDKNVQEYGKRKAELSEARSQLTRYVKSMGGTVNDEGQIEWNNEDIPDTGFFGGRTPALRDDAREVEASRTWLEANLGKKLSGASVSKGQEKSIKTRLSPTNEAGARRGAEALMQEYQDAERLNDASFGKKVVDQYVTNEDVTSRDKRQRSEADQVTPAGRIQLGGQR